MRRAMRPLGPFHLAVLVCAMLSRASHVRGAVILGDIWLLGDSITSGYTVKGAYRSQLYTSLTAAGATFKFVGSSNADSTTSLTNAGQQFHDGHSGWTIANAPGRSGLYEAVQGWYPTISEPEYILLMIGTNDINLDIDRANAPSRLNLLITRLVQLDPTATLIVSSIPAASNSNAYKTASVTDLPAAIQAYNAAIPGVVAQHQALGQHVVFFDMYSKLSLSDLGSDGLHPTQAGYNKIGSAFAAALVPEPGTAFVLGAGVLVLARRRRKCMPERSLVSRATIIA
ncbi:MAG TPA: GDSL-type esterase/lipase family protein [Phycisphaerae bacterium]|nr:GDSL-type esterase/lipase family protein [Phycisphaerae bacterium]